MKVSNLNVLWAFTLLFATIIAIGADDDLIDGDDIDEMVFDFEDPYGDEGDYDDTYIELDDLLSSEDKFGDDKVKSVVKRSWVYKCSDTECKARCQKLLELPDGQCGNAGKCYCRRKTKGL